MSFKLPVPVPEIMWALQLVGNINLAMPEGQQVTLKEPPKVPLVGQVFLLVAFPMKSISVLRVMAPEQGGLILAPVSERWFSDFSAGDKEELLALLCRLKGIDQPSPQAPTSPIDATVVLPGVDVDNWEDGNRAQAREKENSSDNRSS